ncbi:MAG: Ni/Fe hydrogenase subunit alpha, partial [Vicinamibacterales bacterium]
DHGPLVERGLRLKKIGSRILSTLGGREIHPVSVAVGGFYRAPSAVDVRALVDDLHWALDAAIETVRVTGRLEFPDFTPDYEFVALQHPDEYALNEGRVVSNRGVNIDAPDYEDTFVEVQVPHSNALHSVIKGRASYLVGPMARFSLNFGQLPAVAREAAREASLPVPCRNPFQSIVVRAVELVFACAEALRIIDAYEPPSEPRREVANRPGVGHAFTEAPRGLLYHRYAIDERGLILDAKIVPPTSQNQRRIEEDLRELAPQLVTQPLDAATLRCEQAVRNYDPCISCATHFLKLHIDRQ